MTRRLRSHGWLAGAWIVSLVLTVQPFRDSDVWWHLALGRRILAHGIPAVEPFSFLHAANPWVGQQWLYEVGLARVVALGGPALASLLMGMVASTAILVAVLSIPRARRPSGPWMAAAMLLSTLVAAQLVGVRGQVVSLLLTAVLLRVLVRWRQGSARVLLALPPLFALWANIHAGFTIGLGIGLLALVTARGVGSRSRRLLALGLAGAVLATLLNPAGAGLWAYVAATFTNPTVTGVVTEWQSPDFHQLWLRLFAAEAVLLVVGWALAPTRDLFDTLLAAAMVAASLQAQRNVALFAVVAAPQLAVYGAQAWQAQRARLAPLRRPGRRRTAPPWFGVGVLAAVTLGMALAVVPQMDRVAAARFEATHEPMAAVSYASAHLQGHRLYSIDTWGGYLADRLPSGRVVYLYDETAVFGDAALQQYLDIHDLRPGWQEALGRARISDAILPGAAQETAALVVLGWAVDCRDPASGSVVMSARQPSTPPSPLSGPAAIRTAPACA